MNTYPQFGHDWHRRWFVLPGWNALHRVAEIEYTYEDIMGTGKTACGRKGELAMPGILSRIGLPRCKQCCKAVGIPFGDGAPWNDTALSQEQKNA